MDLMLLDLMSWICIMCPLIFAALGVYAYRAYDVHKAHKRFR
jgi:hypothetical protein